MASRFSVLSLYRLANISSSFLWAHTRTLSCAAQHLLRCEFLRCTWSRQLTVGLHSLVTVIGFLDSIVAAKQNGDRFGHPISPNRELVALGTANLAGSFIPGTLPAFGGIVRFVQFASVWTLKPTR